MGLTIERAGGRTLVSTSRLASDPSPDIPVDDAAAAPTEPEPEKRKPREKKQRTKRRDKQRRPDGDKSA